MRSKLLASIAAIAVMAVPASATQFVRASFDQLVQQSESIVHGQVGQVWSSWDADHETISTYAEVHVERYLKGGGEAILIVREVGGTVDDYTQEAIGFPVLRSGEEVVLFLTRWQDTFHPRIQFYDQGKYLVRHEPTGEITVSLDPRTQGTDHLISATGPEVTASRPIAELESMIDAVVQSRGVSQ